MDAVTVGQGTMGHAELGVAADGGEDRNPGRDPVRAGAWPLVRVRALLVSQVGKGVLQRGG